MLFLFTLWRMADIVQQFLTGMRNTTPLEYIAVFAGIASVWFSKKENILVYPVGLVNTILFTWFCFSWWGLYAEGSLNFYYTVMSIYGWYAWSKKREGKKMSITYNSPADWYIATAIFVLSWAVLYFILKSYTSSTVPVADSFASATAYTAMWQMARKKIENWWWWIATNIASIPLYFIKGAVFSSVQYLVFLIMAVWGLFSWRTKIIESRKLLTA